MFYLSTRFCNCLPDGNGGLFQGTIDERSFEFCRQRQCSVGNRCWSARSGKRQRKEETVGGTLTADTSPNSNARSFYFLASAFSFYPPVSLLFPAETIGLVSFTLPVPLLSQRDFRNYEAIYIQMPVSNGHFRESLSTSVSSYRFVPFFRLFSPISPSSFRVLASFRLQKLQ